MCLIVFQVDSAVQRLLDSASAGDAFKTGARTKSSLWPLAAELSKILMASEDGIAVVKCITAILG